MVPSEQMELVEGPQPSSAGAEPLRPQGDGAEAETRLSQSLEHGCAFLKKSFLALIFTNLTIFYLDPKVSKRYFSLWMTFKRLFMYYLRTSCSTVYSCHFRHKNLSTNNQANCANFILK